MKHKQIWPALILLALLLPACGGVDWGMGRTGYFANYDSNGERIYLTGTSASGPIDYTGGDFGGMTRAPARSASVGNRGMTLAPARSAGVGSSQLACADCHGLDGQGNGPMMHMAQVNAPDIRWSTLTEAEADEHGEEDGHEDEHDMEHPPYDEESFMQAVTQGVDPGGEALDPLMPRWQMSDQELSDLITYLKRLG